MVRFSAFCSLLLILVVSAQDASSAHFASVVDVELSDFPDRGEIGPKQVWLNLHNITQRNVRILVLSNEETPPPILTRIQPGLIERLRAVSAGGYVRYQVGITITEAPKQTIRLNVVIVDDDGAVIEHQPVQIYFRVAGGTYELSSYEKLYVPRRSGAPIPTEPTPADQPVELPHLPDGTSGDTFVTRGSRYSTTRSYKVRGRLSYKGLDNAYHSAWNWHVTLQWKRPDGKLRFLASTYVSWNGTWEVSFSTPEYSGQDLLVKYRAGTGYIMPRNEQGKPYSWSDLEKMDSNFRDVGQRTVDTSPSSGNYAGLGDVYNNALLFWWHFRKHQIDLKRSVRLYFPNTWYDCGLGKIWSCANHTGTIWLAPQHAIGAFGIQHELAHQLNNAYWNNQMPPNSAGQNHTTSECSTAGRALVEGFADAVPFWIMLGADSADESAMEKLRFNIEAPPMGAKKGETCEAWVAATLWDLLDSHNDGKDMFKFINPANVFTIYLKGGVKKSIKEPWESYRKAAGRQYRTLVDDVYINNTITVP